MDLRKAELQWLARQQLPMWGGHLERREPVSNANMRQYIDDGLIKAVSRPRLGYIITDKGRRFCGADQ